MSDRRGRLQRDICRRGEHGKVAGQLGTALLCLSLLLMSALAVGPSTAAAAATAADSEPVFGAISCSPQPPNGRWQLSVPVWPQLLVASNESVAICLDKLECATCLRSEVHLTIPWQAGDAASVKLDLSTRKCHIVEPARRLESVAAAGSLMKLGLPCTGQHLSQFAEVRLSTSSLSQVVFLFRDQPKAQCQRVAAVSTNYMYTDANAEGQRRRRPTPQTVTLAVCQFPGQAQGMPLELEFRRRGRPTVSVGADWLRQNGNLTKSADSQQLSLDGGRLSHRLAQLMQLTHGNKPLDGLIIVKEEGLHNATNSVDCHVIADSGPTLTVQPLPKDVEEEVTPQGEQSHSVTRPLVIALVFGVLFACLVALSLFLGVDWRSAKRPPQFLLVLAPPADQQEEDGDDFAHRLERQASLVQAAAASGADVGDCGRWQLLFRRSSAGLDGDVGSFSAVFLVTTPATVLAELSATTASSEEAGPDGAASSSTVPTAAPTANHGSNGSRPPASTCTPCLLLRPWRLEKLVYCLIMVDEAKEQQQELVRQHLESQLGPSQHLGHQRWALVDSVEQCVQLLQSVISRKLELMEDQLRVHVHRDDDDEQRREEAEGRLLV